MKLVCDADTNYGLEVIKIEADRQHHTLLFFLHEYQFIKGLSYEIP